MPVNLFHLLRRKGTAVDQDERRRETPSDIEDGSGGIV